MPYCETCNQSFKNLKALKQHERDSPAHAVSYHSAFGDEDALQQHQRGSPAHTLSYECRFCDRSFISEDALQQHLDYSTVHAQPVSVRNIRTPLDEFFRSFPHFDYDPTAVPSDEMVRLHFVQGWRRGDLHGADAWDRYRTALVQEFNQWYWNNNGLLAWQGLCTDLKVRPLPTSIGACRQAVRGLYFNLMDLIDVKRNDRDDVRLFSTLEELRDYTIRTRRSFPKDSPEAGTLLKHLLREID